MNNYKISRVAEEDIIRIFQYGVKQFGLNQAEKYYNRLFDYFDTIAKNPYAFEAVDYIKAGYRRSVCDSNSIYYRITAEEVEIMTIIRSQDLGYSLFC